MPRQEKTRAIADPLIRALRGTVLEVGAGEGANFDVLDDSIEWIGLEPNPNDTAALRRNARRHGHRRPPIVATCEAIPLEDASVDAVLATLVLCSVDDQALALAEIARVLRPGGSFVFVEHVAAPRRTLLRGAQRAFTPLSRRFDRNCHLDRETVEAIRASALELEELHEYREPSGLGFGLPIAAGRAVKA